LFQAPFVDGSRPAGKSALVVINGADPHQFMIRPDAFTAEDTLAQVPYHEGIGFFKGFGVGHGVEIGFTDAQIGRCLAQLTTIAFGADDTGFRVLGHHQTHDVTPVSDHTRCGGLNLHSGRYRGDAGGHEAAVGFILHQTDAAGAMGFEVRVVAEPGDLDSMVLGRRQEAAAGRTGDPFSVDGQRDGFQKKTPARWWPPPRYQA
jgi:hypothetical protein